MAVEPPDCGSFSQSALSLWLNQHVVEILSLWNANPSEWNAN